MALWIQKSWRIPAKSLNQSMWDPTRDLLDPLMISTIVFGSLFQNQRIQCIRHHRFTSFISAFSEFTFFYSIKMP